MEPIICSEEGCKNVIDPERMVYGRDYWVLINLIEADPRMNLMTSQEIMDEGLANVFCGNCGMICIVEARANKFEVISIRSGGLL